MNDEIITKMEYAWEIHPTDNECIAIYHYGKQVMKIYMGDAIQAVGRKFTMKAVRALDECDYIKSWQKEKFEEVTDILKK